MCKTDFCLACASLFPKLCRRHCCSQKTMDCSASSGSPSHHGDRMRWISREYHCIDRAQQCNTLASWKFLQWPPHFFQLRDTRVEVLLFLEKFLDRVSPRVKGWETTYAVDIRVSSDRLQTFQKYPQQNVWRDCESLSVNHSVFSPCNASVLAGRVHCGVHKGQNS